MKYIFFILAAVPVLFIGYQLVRVTMLARISKELVKNTQPFSVEKEQPTRRFLYLGDSLGVGVGSTAPEFSIAGRLAAEYPEAQILNLSTSGYKIRDGLAAVRQLPPEDKYDVLFIQLGANDVVHLSSRQRVTDDLRKLLQEAQAQAEQVLFFTSGNVGSAPIFPPLVDAFYRRRSKSLYGEFKDIAKEVGVTYVDLYLPPQEDPFVQNPDQYYAADKFHVTDAAYELWYATVMQELDL